MLSSTRTTISLYTLYSNMGDNNSKPPLHKEKMMTESHDGNGNDQNQTKFNYSSTNNAVLHPTEDLIRALIKENRMKNEEIKVERMRMETEIRDRLEEQECNKRLFRAEERKLKEQTEIMKKQTKEQESTKVRPFEFRATDRGLRVKENHIKDQAEIYKKQNELMENRKCVEKQLLGNLVNTEMSKLMRTVKKNPEPIVKQLNDYSHYRRDREEIERKIDDDSKIQEQNSGKFKKNKNKQRSFDFKKRNGNPNKTSNARSQGTKYSLFESQKRVHMNHHSNQNVAVRENQNQLQTTLPAVHYQNHSDTQPPPAYSSHSLHTFNASAANSLIASPSAANYPQHNPVYNILPPSYSSTPQAKIGYNKLNAGEQHYNKFLKGTRTKQRIEQCSNGNKGNTKLVNKL